MVFEESTNSRRRPNVVPANAGAKWAEATSFIRDVRSAYQQDASPNNYERFLIVLKEFKLAHLPLVDCLQLVAGLFKDNPHLFASFNAFAPTEWRLVYENEKVYIHQGTQITEVPENILDNYTTMFENMQRDLEIERNHVLERARIRREAALAAAENNENTA